jgi:hypothetical protein
VIEPRLSLVGFIFAYSLLAAMVREKALAPQLTKAVG